MALEIDLSGKVALVTGGAGGIGFETAKVLREAGADVIIADKIIESVENFVTNRFDVTDEESVIRAFEEIRKIYGHLDILVNCAGITADGLAIRMQKEDWDKVIAVNLTGTFFCCREALKIMTKQKSGSIINIASIVGLYGNAGQANYSASKGGVIALTKTLAKEYGSRSIRVNAIAPGFIETPMTEKLPQDQREKIIQATPLRRLGKPTDVADTVLFLTAGAGFITGEVIEVTGGLVF